MHGTAQMSVKTKKILLITGIAFGTMLLFVVSFFLSLYFIIHPVKVAVPDDGEIAAENQELKIKIKTLEDEIEYLNASADKNKSDVNPPAPVDIPTVTNPPEENKPTADEGNDNTENNEEGTTGEDEDFSPETVITPEGGYEPEADTDITIIDISE